MKAKKRTKKAEPWEFEKLTASDRALIAKGLMLLAESGKVATDIFGCLNGKSERRLEYVCDLASHFSEEPEPGEWHSDQRTFVMKQNKEGLFEHVPVASPSESIKSYRKSLREPR